MMDKGRRRFGRFAGGGNAEGRRPIGRSLAAMKTPARRRQANRSGRRWESVLRLAIHVHRGRREVRPESLRLHVCGSRANKPAVHGSRSRLPAIRNGRNTDGRRSRLAIRQTFVELEKCATQAVPLCAGRYVVEDRDQSWHSGDEPIQNRVQTVDRPTATIVVATFPRPVGSVWAVGLFGAGRPSFWGHDVTVGSGRPSAARRCEVDTTQRRPTRITGTPSIRLPVRW